MLAARFDQPSSRVFRLCDTFLAIGAIIASFTVVNLGRMPHGADDFLAQRVSIKNVLLLGAFLCCWQLAFDVCGLYSRRRDTIKSQALRIVLACTMAASCLLLFPSASNSGAFSLSVVLGFWVVTTTAEISARCGFKARRSLRPETRRPRAAGRHCGKRAACLTAEPRA